MKANKYERWTATKYWPFFFIAKHIFLVGNIKNKTRYPCAMKSQPQYKRGNRCQLLFEEGQGRRILA